MSIESIKNTLSQSFKKLEEVAPNIFCATDTYNDKPYAIRYFDLSDNIASTSEDLDKYLEDVLGERYFDTDRPTDLRWNNYLYFITSDNKRNEDFQKAKFIIESDREYARKFVITESEIPRFIQLDSSDKHQSDVEIQDLYSIWVKLLNEQQLGYLLDFNLSAPKIVRKIGDGGLGKLEQVTSVGELNEAERDAISSPIKILTKKGFRKHPQDGEFSFGSRVNLITGPNGHGKTSLLETVEFLYCGSTYRNGLVESNTKISASLIGSHEVLETKSTKQFSKQLKVRNLGWYGKNDLRNNTLSKSFSRFNFMDTDAAVRLSVDETPENLSKDIARIVLGAEAGKASDQIQRVFLELEKQSNNSAKNIRQLGEQVRLLEEEKESLSSMTKQSDTLFQQLVQQLKTMCWVDSGSNNDDASINDLSLKLTSANHHCKLLEGKNLNDLKNRYKDLELYKDSLTNLESSASILDKELLSISQKKETIVNKYTNIKELQTYSGTNLLYLDKSRNDQIEIINKLEDKLPDLRRIYLLNDVASLTLEEALAETKEKLSQAISDKDLMLTRIDKIDRSQTVIKTLRDQLGSAATKLLESLSDKNHCPLCNSKFEEGELMLRIASNLDQESNSVSIELRNRLMVLKENEANLYQKNHLLLMLSEYCNGVTHTSVTNSLNVIEESTIKINEYEKSLSAINNKLEEYQERGLKIERFKELLEIFEMKEYVPDVVGALLKTLREDSKNLAGHFEIKKSELDIVNQKIAVLSEMADFTKTLSAVSLRKSIDAEMSHYNKMIASAKDLADFIDLKSDFSSISLSHQIDDAREMISKLITARQQENEKSSRMDKVEKNIKSSHDLQSENKIVLNRLLNATGILNNLISGENSLENIQSELLRNNAGIISEIFSRIHLPNEYDINLDGDEIRLIHKATGKAQSLNEVSTGQRTAFALSLFLTVNKTLSSGPMTLLLDDPISHVDDVNMLSFLDYLRELAIDGSRQIFFATPNAKLAGLFRHKFNFLGDDEYKEIKMMR